MPRKEEIEKLYSEFSLRVVAQKLDLSYSGLQYWMSIYKIPKRTKSEAQLGIRNHAFGKLGTQSKRHGNLHKEKTKQKLSENRIGAQNPNWKGGSTNLTNRIRQIREYKEWRKANLIKMPHCSECHSTNNLEVDHVMQLSRLLKMHNISSVVEAKKCKLLWEVSNGRVLCHSCHRKHHFKS